MASSRAAPNWSLEGRDWPNRASSRFVCSGGLDWHVQEMGEGPRLLLLHGTGAATHSFRDLAPLLAKHFSVLMIDLPGHGFTAMPAPNGLSLPGMARLVGGLLTRIGFVPQLAVGHSAGAAILVFMALEKMIQPQAIIGINAAIRPIRGAALFSPLAKLLFLNPLMPRLFAWRADGPGATRRLLEGTGSRLDDKGVELYERLFRRSGHVAATLGMMANWDLDSLERRLGRVDLPLILVSAAHDKAVPPGDAALLASRNEKARAISLDHGGHLVHEEHPDEIAALILKVAADEGVISKPT